MRLFITHSHTSTLRGYEAPGKKLKQKTTNGERKTGNEPQTTPANGGINSARTIDHFPQMTEGNTENPREWRDQQARELFITFPQVTEGNRSKGSRRTKERTENGKREASSECYNTRASSHPKGLQEIPRIFVAPHTRKLNISPVTRLRRRPFAHETRSDISMRL